MSKYILASASPRRRELFKLISDDYIVVPSYEPEILPQNHPVSDIPEYLAKRKALSVAKLYKDKIIIAADTSVIIDQIILGKPKDEKDAKQMLKTLSGNTHKVITGCVILNGENCNSFSVETKVEFFDLTDKEIDDYINTKEPFDKAGAYGIQGYGSLLVKGIQGDYYNVVGLPVSRLFRELNK